MRISDLGSDGCSSDLTEQWLGGTQSRGDRVPRQLQQPHVKNDVEARRLQVSLGHERIAGDRLVEALNARVGQQSAEFGTKRLTLDRGRPVGIDLPDRSEEHTTELQSLMRISYAVFCL